MDLFSMIDNVFVDITDSGIPRCAGQCQRDRERDDAMLVVWALVGHSLTLFIAPSIKSTKDRREICYSSYVDGFALCSAMWPACRS